MMWRSCGNIILNILYNVHFWRCSTLVMDLVRLECWRIHLGNTWPIHHCIFRLLSGCTSRSICVATDSISSPNWLVTSGSFGLCLASGPFVLLDWLSFLVPPWLVLSRSWTICRLSIVILDRKAWSWPHHLKSGWFRTSKTTSDMNGCSSNEFLHRSIGSITNQTARGLIISLNNSWDRSTRGLSIVFWYWGYQSPCQKH